MWLLLEAVGVESIRQFGLGMTSTRARSTGRLRGHTENYTDPATGKSISAGVLVWHNFDIIRRFLERLGVKCSIGGLAEAHTLSSMWTTRPART
ncbi:hypothetical protein BJ742DRAFT_822654 [Cladochytrium replicatum]|nr:hypothetical protein BJ742DRAFT_822654 [Cladochytrium replicatum]